MELALKEWTARCQAVQMRDPTCWVLWTSPNLTAMSEWSEWSLTTPVRVRMISYGLDFSLKVPLYHSGPNTDRKLKLSWSLWLVTKSIMHSIFKKLSWSLSLVTKIILHSTFKRARKIKLHSKRIKAACIFLLQLVDPLEMISTWWYMHFTLRQHELPWKRKVNVQPRFPAHLNHVLSSTLKSRSTWNKWQEARAKQEEKECKIKTNRLCMSGGAGWRSGSRWWSER